MSFSSPEWLCLLIPLLLMAWWIGVQRRRSGRSLAYPTLEIASEVPASVRRRVFAIRRYLPVLGAGCLVIALAGPRWEHSISLTAGRGVDALIVLDVSSSMQRADLAGRRSAIVAGSVGDPATRLDIARDVIADFVRRRTNDRLGLMTFARFARSTCPLTTDHDALLTGLSQVRSVEPGSDEDQTGVGVALATAIQQVAGSNAESRVVVLLTDGEETVRALSAQEAAEYGRSVGVRVYSIAVGRQVGEWAEALTEAATLTGGRGYVAHGADELRGIYAEIDQLEVSDIEEVHQVFHTPLHRIAILVGLALMVLGPILDATWFRRAP